MTTETNNAPVVQDDDAEVAVELLSGVESLSAVERAQVDSQVATARAWPRSITGALREATELATMDEDTAAECFYVLPRAGKRIEGPSIRLAEIMAYAWQHLRWDAAIESEDRTHITAVATCFDLERNVAVRIRVKRRITKRNGTRYDDDMIGVAGNAAISIALRNAIFRVIPHVFTNRVYQLARQASIGKAGTMTQKRQNALAWFGKAGVSDEQMFAVLEVKGMDDIGEDELIALRGLRTAIKEGDTTVEQVFRRHDVSDGASELNDALGATDDLEGDMPDLGGEVSLGSLAALAGVGPKDRDAIVSRLGIKSVAHDVDAYAAELRRIAAERQEAES